MAYRAKHSLNIVDRPITKNKNEVCVGCGHAIAAGVAE
jgi:hypothetical protein